MTPEEKVRQAEMLAASIVKTWREGACMCHSDDARLQLLIATAIMGIFTQAEITMEALLRRHRWPDR